jgi:hypothetical protein
MDSTRNVYWEAGIRAILDVTKSLVSSYTVLVAALRIGNNIRKSVLRNVVH